MSLEFTGEKPKSSSWSKKEILGHLIDSAANNHQRIVRGIQNIAIDFPQYQADGWVTAQRYNEADWSDLIELFCWYNLHLCYVIEGIPEESLKNPCNIGEEEPVTLEFIVTGYLRHLKHHLDKITEV